MEHDLFLKPHHLVYCTNMNSLGLSWHFIKSIYNHKANTAIQYKIPSAIETCIIQEIPFENSIVFHFIVRCSAHKKYIYLIKIKTHNSHELNKQLLIELDKKFKQTLQKCKRHVRYIQHKCYT